MKLPIYLDYAATTPIDSRVVKKMLKYMSINGDFGNPASKSHLFGWKAAEAINKARIHIAELVNANFYEIIFTSGSTESNNLAIKGISSFYKKKGNHIITSEIEHKSVLDTCHQLENAGFQVTYLSPKQSGRISLENLKNSICENTILVSIMHVNNEIGVIQDIYKIGEICNNKNIIFHVDATQSVGKLSIDLQKLKVDLMSFSAHKLNGPMGIGALYIRNSPFVKLDAQIHGGGHEKGIRSGTLPVHQIVGMGEAYKISKREMKEEFIRICSFRNLLWNSIRHTGKILLNGDLNYSIPHILNISFKNISNELLTFFFKNLAVSSGSACMSEFNQPSYVLKSLGLSNKLAYNSMRFSFGRFTKKEEINYVIDLIKSKI